MRIHSRVINRVIIFILGLGLLGWSVSLKIGHVVCQLNEQVCPTDVADTLNTLSGTSYFYTDLEHTAAQTLASHPSYQVASVRRDFPNTVVISITLSSPSYYLKQADTGAMMLVDANGHLLPSDQSLPLPYVLVTKIPDPGQPLDTRTHQWLMDTISSLKRNNLTPDYVVIVSPDELLIELPNNKVAIVDHQQPSIEIDRLSLVVKGLDPDKLKDVQEIDVRYALPVLRKTRTIPRHNSS